MSKFVVRDRARGDVVEVYLEEDGCGVIVLQTDQWAIAGLTADGRLVVYEGISKDNGEGLQVDSAGRIKVVKE